MQTNDELNRMGPVKYFDYCRKRGAELMKQARNEWLAVIQQLWTATGKPVDSERLMIYAKSLDAVPLGLLETAVGNMLQQHTYATVPQVGEVWRAVNDELNRTACYSIDAWMRSKATGAYAMTEDGLEVIG